MKSIVSLFIMLYFAAMAHAQTDESLRLISVSSSETDDMLVVDVSMKDLLDAPTWDPKTEAIPLPVTNAVASVIAWAKSETPEATSFRATKIEINSGTIHSRIVWYYVISVTEKTDATGTSRDDLFAIVLFDGKVIPRKIEKKE
ncbi:hypothetical protein BVX97_04965 [bacterium E08(2017)]|nr:hypothetical protein BVX97_04965 [bacterium E08(2017)]